ncbi:MAG: alpha-galactosidase [Clostridiales bacterium]|nr:alpha-galactosidase [Clostridiales bacterium]
MNNPKFICNYRHDGQDYCLVGDKSEFLDADISITDSKINLTLKPKGLVALLDAKIEFDNKFSDGDKFFANGYQSWSTSREYVKTDFQSGVNPIAKGKLLDIARISSDEWFYKNDRKKGIFHSHCYTYIKNGGNFLFMGSLSERQGYTVFRADMNANTLSVIKDVEGVAISEKYELFDIVIMNGSEDEVFDVYFAAMGLKKPRIDHLAGYTSWYNYYQKINQSIILRDLDAMDKVHDDVNVFQIDDGYETFVGDWLDPNPSKFPDGMKYIADKIHDKGYMAGIWLAPFNVQIKSRTYREHPDWIIRTNTGKPVLGCPGWGGAYTLDIYNPEAREYIKSFFNVILNDWGYDMVKLDFLYSQCQIPRNNKSRGTIMCEAMEFLRECCGDKLILGCGAPLGAAFGYVDACRIGCDVDRVFKGRFYNKIETNSEVISAQNALNNTIFRRQLNGRAFLNDPDVFFFRYSNLRFDMNQKILLANINHLCGDVLFVSDNMNEYKEADVQAAKRIFKKSDWKVLDANYACDNKKVILKLLDNEGNVKMLWFNMDNGFGNQDTVMRMSTSR